MNPAACTYEQGQHTDLKPKSIHRSATAPESWGAAAAHNTSHTFPPDFCRLAIKYPRPFEIFLLKLNSVFFEVKNQRTIIRR